MYKHLRYSFEDSTVIDTISSEMNTGTLNNASAAIVSIVFVADITQYVTGPAPAPATLINPRRGSTVAISSVIVAFFFALVIFVSTALYYYKGRFQEYESVDLNTDENIDESNDINKYEDCDENIEENDEDYGENDDEDYDDTDDDNDCENDDENDENDDENDDNDDENDEDVLRVEF